MPGKTLISYTISETYMNDFECDEIEAKDEEDATNKIEAMYKRKRDEEML